MAIADKLIPKLRERFPDRGLTIGATAQPCAVFPAIHPEVGDIEIHDDGDELTLVAGNLTHGHFSNYEDDLTEAQKAEAITEEIIEFLDAVFADRVAFWGSHNGAGGWYRRDHSGTGQSTWPLGGKGTVKRNEYVWSGPLNASTANLGPIQKLANYLWGRRK